MINIHDFYNKAEITTDYLTGEGTPCTFSSGTLSLPKLISRIWTTRQVGELPTVTVGDKSIQEDMFPNDILKDIAPLVNKLMAYGKVIVVPYTNTLGEIAFDVMSEYDNSVKYFQTDGNLEQLEYRVLTEFLVDKVIKTKTVYHIYYKEGNSFYYQRYFKENKGIVYLNDPNGNPYNGSSPISEDEMPPFIINLRLNADSLGLPVYYNAIKNIEDSDKTYHEMLNVMELLRPIVGIPQALLGSDNRNEKKFTVSSVHRMFAYIPGMSEIMDWKYFGGTFDPTPYLNALDVQLNLVSIHSGLGHRFLSFDRNTGGTKTATEVSYGQQDLFINQVMINQTINELLIKMVRSSWQILNDEWLDAKNIKVKFEDSIYNNVLEYRAQLTHDRATKEINQEWYLSQMYPSEKVKEIKEHQIEEEPIDIYKTPEE